ncbi:MAG TPA: M17 family peptidase N-terminal domain-containing protein [Polyangiaceae bacterium]|nr:M17 family peptidase N-terminal domain-containing protein [Polyangiaceae bacterium]
MELRFLTPEPAHLDEANVELCACSIWSDERPIRGFAELLDWRLGGRLSAMLKAGFADGHAGEMLLVPGKPHVPFEKVLIMGLGARSSFDEIAFRDALARTARALEGLRVRRAVVELPGRTSGAIDPEKAISLTLESLGTSRDHDVWWLVDSPAARKQIEQRAADERRRGRAR